MPLSVENFFELLLRELEENKNLTAYYKFGADKKRFLFRKAYFCQRLAYVLREVERAAPAETWDCGCGYGTTALFLALNGYKVLGTTLEFYFSEIETRRRFWSRYGDVSGFDCRYENLFDADYREAFDVVVVQDTLHHVEPIGEGLAVLAKALRPSGKLIVIEENGANVVQNLKLLKQRGFKKVVSAYDEKQQKEFLLGNENIRSFRQWEKLFRNAGLRPEPESLEFIRYYLPPFVNVSSVQALAQKEAAVARRSPFLKTYFFFGINFTAVKA